MWLLRRFMCFVISSIFIEMEKVGIALHSTYKCTRLALNEENKNFQKIVSLKVTVFNFVKAQKIQSALEG